MRFPFTAPPEPVATPPPQATLDHVMAELRAVRLDLASVHQRSVRTETRLVRLMEAQGLPHHDPRGGQV